MAIIYKDIDGKIFYVRERYQVEQDDWVRYTNHLGDEFTCRTEAFNTRFSPMEQE